MKKLVLVIVIIVAILLGLLTATTNAASTPHVTVNAGVYNDLAYTPFTDTTRVDVGTRFAYTILSDWRNGDNQPLVFTLDYRLNWYSMTGNCASAKHFDYTTNLLTQICTPNAAYGTGPKQQQVFVVVNQYAIKDKSPILLLVSYKDETVIHSIAVAGASTVVSSPVINELPKAPIKKR